MFGKITQDMIDEIQVEAGAILKNFDPEDPSSVADSDFICATTGGITANCVPTFEDWGSDIDNCPDNAKEMKHITGYECTFAFTSIGVSESFIKLALGAADIVEGKVVPRTEVKATDFTNLWFVSDKSAGGMLAILLKNALSTGGFSLKTTKKNKGQVSVTLTGHVSITDPDAVPMEFYSTAAA